MPDNSKGNMLPWQWAEAPTASKHGEGISRPKPKARTRQFCVRVHPAGAQPMTWITQAETKKHAISYALARWPEAAVEVVA